MVAPYLVMTQKPSVASPITVFMVLPGARLFNLVPFERWRHARGKEHCRGESDSALSGGYAPDSARAARSSTSQGSAEPLCARIKGANREVSERKTDL